MWTVVWTVKPSHLSQSQSQSAARIIAIEAKLSVPQELGGEASKESAATERSVRVEEKGTGSEAESESGSAQKGGSGSIETVAVDWIASGSSEPKRFRSKLSVTLDREKNNVWEREHTFSSILSKSFFIVNPFPKEFWEVTREIIFEPLPFPFPMPEGLAFSSSSSSSSSSTSSSSLSTSSPSLSAATLVSPQSILESVLPSEPNSTSQGLIETPSRLEIPSPDVAPSVEEQPTASGGGAAEKAAEERSPEVEVEVEVAVETKVDSEVAVKGSPEFPVPVFVLNLDRRLDRKVAMAACIENVPGMKASTHWLSSKPKTDAQVLEVSGKEQREKAKDKNKDTSKDQEKDKEKHKSPTDAMLARTLSHAHAASRFLHDVSLSKAPFALVLEDDARFPSTIGKILEGIVKAAPDADLILLAPRPEGKEDLKLGEETEALGKRIFEIPVTSAKLYPFSESLLGQMETLGCCARLISRNFAELLIAEGVYAEGIDRQGFTRLKAKAAKWFVFPPVMAEAVGWEKEARSSVAISDVDQGQMMARAKYWKGYATW